MPACKLNAYSLLNIHLLSDSHFKEIVPIAQATLLFVGHEECHVSFHETHMMKKEAK